MKSRASIKSHPIHPILVSFPIAFFFGSFVFDVLGWLREDPDLWNVGWMMNIAGVIGGLLAAIPGIIDYINTIPPDSSAKQRAKSHAITNTFNILLFAGVAYYRYGWLENESLVLTAEAIGVVTLSIAGWLGGTLVYRNQIGVDPRYANAGKWNEEYISSKAEWVAVANTGELSLNQMKLVHLNGTRIVIAKTEDGFRAFSDHCTHRGGSLAGGSMICGTVQCPWHGSQFDVTSGAVKSGPAEQHIDVYPVEIREGKVFVRNQLKELNR
jgi:uncharacterized membrane protein/nitrite reductase/ring-hydroxylating ferredoxin subunit